MNNSKFLLNRIGRDVCCLLGRHLWSGFFYDRECCKNLRQKCLNCTLVRMKSSAGVLIYCDKNSHRPSKVC